jgi:hypothetical protein
MAYRFLAGLWLSVVLTLSPALGFDGGLGEDLIVSPPAFMVNGKLAVPVDLQSEKVEFVFDAIRKKARATARLEFFSRDSGYPIFDLIPSPRTVKLNGQLLGRDGFPTIMPPDRVTTFRIVNRRVQAQSTNILEVEYDIPDQYVTFGSSGVRMGFFMYDVGEDRSFWEQYAPASLEYDHFGLDVTVTVLGGNGRQEIFSNGQKEVLGKDSWRVRFPRYFTSSSPYLHLTDGRMTVKEEEFPGREKQISLVVYSANSSLVEPALEKIKDVMRENEEVFGPFTHSSFVAYITEESGGMEYCGATISNMEALGHELTHSWFARGVMPSNGNSGWIDEAIASWRDDGYPENDPPTGDPVNLAAYSPYRRTTPDVAYTEGAYLLGHLDTLFRRTHSGGLKTILSDLYTQRKLRGITTSFFKKFLETGANTSLTPLFDKYVYAKGHKGQEKKKPSSRRRHHPLPYSAKDRLTIR